MPRPTREPRHSVSVDMEVFKGLSSVAEAMDVGTAPLVSAALAGLLRAGQVERFVQLGAADERLARQLSRSRVRGGRLWTRVGGPGPQVHRGDAAMWETEGGWLLQFQGDPHAVKKVRRDTGWYLYGPGIEVGIFQGRARPAATESANAYIARYDAAQAARAAAPPPASEDGSGAEGGLS